ncbi:hypothetical protein CF319_g5915 [Tilletia indica]|nr:hypothetical protein CF319_g5915 [Tilletia indica]
MDAPEQHPDVPTNAEAHDEPPGPTQPNATQEPPIPTVPRASHSSDPAKREITRQPSIPTKRKDTLDSVPHVSRGGTPSEAPSEGSTAISDMDDSSDEDHSYLYDVDPMDSRDVLMLARELFAHLAPYATTWSRVQRLKIGTIFVDLGYLLMPGVFD